MGGSQFKAHAQMLFDKLQMLLKKDEPKNSAADIAKELHDFIEQELSKTKLEQKIIVDRMADLLSSTQPELYINLVKQKPSPPKITSKIFELLTGSITAKN